MLYSHVLFDLDGTLCDPGPGITDSVAYALLQMGIVEKDHEVLRRFVGPPLLHSFKEIYNLNDSKANQAVEIYRKRFEQKGIYEYTVYPGIDSLLTQLKKQGAVMAVATSKIEPFALQILKSVRILNSFSFVSADIPNKPKLKAETIANALDYFHVDNKSNAVMVGDKEHDIIGANENKIDSIGVLYGYGSKVDLVRESATHIVNDVDELAKLLLK